MDILIEKSNRLKGIEKSIVKSIIDMEPKNFGKLVGEYGEVKKQIRLISMENPVLTGIQDKPTLEIIKSISANIPLPLEKVLDGGDLADYLDCELSIEELEEIGEEEFLTWFSHLDYAKARFEFGSLIFQIGDIPPILTRFIIEARESFIFQQYLAFTCICRTIVEISVRDICLRKGIIKPDSKKISYMEQLNLFGMIDKVSSGSLNKKLHDIRRHTNKIIHGKNIIQRTSKEAKETLKGILIVIQDLYSFHGY